MRWTPIFGQGIKFIIIIIIIKRRGFTMGKKNKYTAAFKARVALKAAKGDKSINEIASEDYDTTGSIPSR